MSKKSKKKRTAKKATTKAAPKAAANTNAAKVVFAFRLMPAERDAIHKAAGPRGASRFVLDAALAAANKA